MLPEPVIAEVAPRSILFVQVTRIGDTLLSTPLLRAIAKAWPEASLDCLAHPKRKEVLEHLSFLHYVGGITPRTSVWRGWWPGRHYDLAFVGGHDAPLVRYALRMARRVVALRQGDETLDRQLWRCVEPRLFQEAHAVEMQLTLSDALGLPRDGLYLSYTVCPKETDWARQRLATDLGNSVAGPLIGLQVASFPTKSYRDWPIENFIDLCGRIRQRHPGVRFLIFGGNLERERTQQLHRAFPDCSVHYAGRLSLRQTAALMNCLDLYIGVDTGPTHIMGALHRPMVALYHGFSPSRLLAPLEHPCLWTVDHPRAGQCGPEATMAEIAVETVWEKVCAALKESRP